jgi:hypothetical protein
VQDLNELVIFAGTHRRETSNHLQAEARKCETLSVASSSREDRYSIPRLDLVRERKGKRACTGGQFEPNSRSQTTPVSEGRIDDPSFDFDHMLPLFP